jgi:hypothetical protein
MYRSFILAGIAMVTLAGCATAPIVGRPAEVTGTLPDSTVAFRSAAGILSVDRKPMTDRVVSVLSGLRTIEFQALPIPGHRGGEVRSMQITIRPCTRYYINVQRKSATSMDWEPVISREEPMAGCEAK